MNTSLNLAREQLASGLGEDEAAQSIAAFSETLLAIIRGHAQDAKLDVFVGGGLAARLLAPYADADVGVILGSQNASVSDDEEQRAATFFAALWDEGFSVGSALCSWDELNARAEDDGHFRTLCINAEVIHDESKSSYERLARFRREQNVDDFLAQKREEIFQRRALFADAVYLREPNVKSSPGGLRDIQAVLWMGRVLATSSEAFRLAPFAHLEEVGVLFPREERILNAARVLLGRIRCALHLEAKRKEERLLYEHQEGVATRLGFEDGNALMRAYFDAAVLVRRTVDDVVARWCMPMSDGESEKKIGEHFLSTGARLYISDAELFEREPSLMVDALRVCAENGYTLSAQTQESLYAAATTLEKKPLFDDEKCGRALHRLMNTNASGMPFRTLLESGVLHVILRDFARLKGHYKQDAYHAFTVDAHSCRCADKALRFQSGIEEVPQPLEDIAARCRRNDWVTCASFFHDLGKGTGRDHSVVGEEIVRRELARFGASEEEIEAVSLLVREHLLLSHASQRRDLSDPKVIEELAAHIGSVELLDALTVLTWIDTSSVAPGMFTDWKARLLRLANQRVREFLEAPEDGAELRGVGPDEQREQARQSLAGEVEAPELKEFLDGTTEFVFARRLESELLEDAKAFESWARQERDGAPRPFVDVKKDGENPASVVRVVDTDRAFLFADITNVIADLGANLLHAHLSTRDDGVIIDALRIEENQNALSPEREKHLASALYQTLVAREGPRKLNVVSYPEPPGLQKFVRIDPTPDEHGIYLVELRAGERPRLAADIALVFAEQKFSIVLAKLAVEGEAVRDSFYVRKGEGAQLSSLESALNTLVGTDVH